MAQHNDKSINTLTPFESVRIVKFSRYSRYSRYFRHFSEGSGGTPVERAEDDAAWWLKLCHLPARQELLDGLELQALQVARRGRR